MSSGPRIPAGKPGKFSTGGEQYKQLISGELRFLTIGSCRELTTGSKSVRHETLKHDRAQIGTSKIYGSGMSCRSRSNDDLEIPFSAGTKT